MKAAAALAVLQLCLLAGSAVSSGKPAPAPFEFFALCMDTHDSARRSLPEQAQLLSELGYDGAGHLWLDNLPERLRTLDNAHLQLYQVYFRVNLKPGAEPFDPRLAQSLELLAGRKTTLAVLVSGLRPSDTSGDGRAVDIIREIADQCAKKGVRVALYPHAGDWLERVEDALRLIEKVDRSKVGVVFNLCHWLKVDGQDEHLRPLLQKALPHLLGVTINGADTADEIRNRTGKWIQPLGQGSFDTCRFLETLYDLGYRGPVGLQCYGIPGDARIHLTQSINAWNSCIARLNCDSRQ